MEFQEKNAFWIYLPLVSETKCTVHAALPQWPINQLKPVQQSRQRAYYPNIYSVSANPVAYLKPVRSAPIKAQNLNS
jgi:hypothetical protein